MKARTLRWWRAAQVAAWLVGTALLACLVARPALGLRLFWNLLIPVAPALLVVSPGIWRNVCPLATTTLLPRHLGWSQRRRLQPRQSALLHLGAVLTLYTVVPLRHALFNQHGPATAALLVTVAVAATALGTVFDWKSAWCAGLCPVHPVERLYGGKVALSVMNAHCGSCANCSVPCPDATPDFHPGLARRDRVGRLAALLITGGLPGFVWGWFQVPDGPRLDSLAGLVSLYGWPLGGLGISLALYLALSRVVPPRHERTLVSTFAAAAVSCYYLYRLPSLFGFGEAGDGGLLWDLRGTLPAWALSLATAASVAFFFYWLVGRQRSRRSWVVRPGFALRESRG